MHSEEPNKPFNDAMDHLNKIGGVPINRGGRLPLPIKIIGYCLFGGMVLMILLGVLISIFN